MKSPSDIPVGVIVIPDILSTLFTEMCLRTHASVCKGLGMHPDMRAGASYPIALSMSRSGCVLKPV